MSSKPRRLAVLAVATTLATAAGTAQAASTQSATPTAAAQPSAHWVVVPESAAVTPPASVSGLARDLGVDNDFARRVLDELTSSR